MTRFIIAGMLAILLAGTGAIAQDRSAVWVQIEAHPSLAETEQAIRGYASRLEDVKGFTIGGGWYAIALGPYRPADAEQVLGVYRAEGLIPGDSYIAFSSTYLRQIWPVGADDLALLEPRTTGVPRVAPQAEEPAAPAPQVADETPRQARAAERLLTREEREELQIALQWAGFYRSAIDGAFGPGTRNAMAEWQAANGFEVTGVLTTLQRRELIGQYNAVLDGLDLRIVRDADAGIEMRLPMGVLAFETYEAPFAHYTASGGIDARVLLISQEGDAATLRGLYDIMQTLAIVPNEGPREFGANRFVLTGRDAKIVSHTEASLKGGEIKGFTLIWPAGDEERRTRLLAEMQESFARLDGVLDPSAGSTEEQRIDLVSGLEVRKPLLSRSGFYVDGQGTVVTTGDVVQGCGRVTIDEDYEAKLVAGDATLGIAVLRPMEALAPRVVADFQNAVPRLKSEVAVAGYSYGGVLGAPTVTFGQLADLRGLNGESNLKRLALAALDGDAGGPVLDAGGAVLGMLLPGMQERKLPAGVSLAADAGALARILAEAGVTVGATETLDRIAPEDLTDKAAGMTVLVSCWE